jgi:hypothetical protein
VLSCKKKKKIDLSTQIKMNVCLSVLLYSMDSKTIHPIIVTIWEIIRYILLVLSKGHIRRCEVSSRVAHNLIFLDTVLPIRCHPS